MNPKVLSVVALLLTGYTFGVMLEEPDVKYRVIHDTKTVRPDAEVIHVPALTGPCKDAVREADKIVSGVLGIDTTGSYLLDSISEARQAVAGGDSNQLNTIETALRKKEAGLLRYFEAVAENQNQYNQDKQDCEEQSDAR